MSGLSLCKKLKVSVSDPQHANRICLLGEFLYLVYVTVNVAQEKQLNSRKGERTHKLAAFVAESHL